MVFLARNVQLGAPLKLSAWRKIALGTWGRAGDPSIYAVLELDAEPALAYIAQIRQHSGAKITFTHFVGKAIAQVYSQHPQLNCVLRFGRLYPRPSIDVFFQVATDKAGTDLSGTVIREADQKPLAAIADEMQHLVTTIRTKGDPGFRKMKSSLGLLPGILMRPVMSIAGFFMYGLNLWSPLLGSPPDAFGGVMVTSIGSIGLDMAFAPLVPYSRVPLLLAVGSIREAAVVRGGEVVIAKMSRLCITIDHRIIDGVQGSMMAQALQRIFADPAAEFKN